MTFKLTADTDPKTVMFEGHPEVTIDRIRRTLSEQHPDDFYVYVGENPKGAVFSTGTVRPGNNHIYSPDGIDCGYTLGWPRIVPRPTPKFDPTKPIEGVLPGGRRYAYELVGTFTPADGSEPIYHLRHGTSPVLAEVYASTGRVVKGVSHAHVEFRNVAEPHTYRATREVEITELDGKILKVELI